MSADDAHPSHRHAAFAREYVTNGGNGTQAAIAAGYVDNGTGAIRVTASRLLTDANVRADIERRQRALQVRSDYTVEQWRSDILADIERASEAGNHSAVMKGRELLGRHMGAWSLALSKRSMTCST